MMQNPIEASDYPSLNSMALIESKLKPCSGKHSIKEAVISIFLSDPLNLDEFADIKLPKISSTTLKVEKITKVEILVDNEAPEVERNRLSEPKIVGIRFVEEDTENEASSIRKILQGINEDNRNFISYHNFNYYRWNDFFSEYLAYIKVIAERFDDMSASAFSLLYVDEFNWIGDGPIVQNVVFNEDSKHIPKAFFTSSNGNLSLTTERLFEDSNCLDRLDISTDKQSGQIVVSHNLVRILNEGTPLTTLLKLDEFSKILTWAHNQNKELLLQIFQPEVSRLVNLVHD